MTWDPEAKAVVDELHAKAEPMPLDTATWLKAYRAELDAIVAMQGPPPDITVSETVVWTEDGARLPMRCYEPGDPGDVPTLLFIHGGGFVAGTLDGYDVPLRWLARRSGWRIAAIDYRLAPEHPFPAAPDDCMAALRSILNMRGVDPGCVGVGGDSAGGLLATVVARRARETGLPLAVQVMLYPNTDLREGDHHASRTAYDGIVVRIDELYRSLDLYLGAADRTAVDVSPLVAEDLAGLCPALLVTVENDPLRDEAEAYGVRLRAADVPVEAIRLPGQIHGVLQRAARIEAGDALISLIAERLVAASIERASLRAL